MKEDIIYDLVDPETLEIVKTVTSKELFKLLGIKGVCGLRSIQYIDGLLVTER